MKVVVIIPLLLFCHWLAAQTTADAWVDSQLNDIVWQATYKGVLADYHPITLILSSDHEMVAGYLIHNGDQRKHRLIGEWSKTDRFQLQERDDNDRLTGYLTGSITSDHVQMEWMSADQSRLFNVKAFPETLIRIKNFKPVAEWIEIASTPSVKLSVQKMDYGIVSGIANRDGHFSRFEGYCLDGSCSIWNTVIQNPNGAPIRVQMRQKDGTNYKASLDGIDYPAAILYSDPLTLRQFDNSMGFLDFVYPQFESTTYAAWIARWVDKTWTEGVNYLTSINKTENAGRLVHRSSGWIEILDEGDSYVSGLITYINPGVTRREAFVWLKKEDVFLSQEELINTPADLKTASGLALAAVKSTDDQEYQDWLQKAGYTFLSPAHSGIIMTTEFNMVYGDDIGEIALEKSKDLIRKKYWKYFGW
jgi:hypothetical protein